MNVKDFRPRPKEWFQTWHERICPRDHELLKDEDGAGRKGKVVRAAHVEGRLALVFDILKDCGRVNDADTLVEMMLAGEHALLQPRETVRAVNELLDESGAGDD